MENPTNTNSPSKPNIILITVDQLRFPMHLPPDNNTTLTPNTFLQNYMNNLWTYLWNDGVKFSNYYTAASDCTAARATIHTGLYGYQTYSMLTLISYPPDIPTQPVLQKEFPTIGRLMREQAGYELTPYFGKWHLSYDVSDLEKYGYTSYTPNQDYVGYAGEGYATDDTPAWEAAHWINNHVATPGSKPFFLTLNFVNPHDKQWFWGGMQANNFYEAYAGIASEILKDPPPGPYIEIPSQDQPPSIYHSDIYRAIPNFEEQAALSKKPKTQSLVKEVFQYQMGGIFEDDGQYGTVTSPPGFYYAPALAHQPDYKVIAPKKYWSMAMDSYVQIMGQVDQAIGNFMQSISEEVKQNAIFIFTSDHGEYGSSHGLQGKGGTVYEEGIRVPLIVCDLSHRFTSEENLERKQLTSSVDLLRMIVSMGYGGTGWMTGNSDYQQLYGNRCDLLSILRSNSAPGRTYALHSTDEFVPDVYNYNDSNLHVIGQITCDSNGANKKKLGVYTTWEPDSDSPEHATVIQPAPDNVEFYNLTNDPDEKMNVPYNDQQVQTALATLFGGSQFGLLYSELQARLPDKYQPAQTTAYQQLVEYMKLVNEMADQNTQNAAALEEVQRRLDLVWAL